MFTNKYELTFDLTQWKWVVVSSSPCRFLV